MSNTAEDKVMDLWQQSIKSEIDILKGENQKIKEDIRTIQDKQLQQDGIIQNILNSLGEIKDDTKWLKRTITGAIITAVCTGVIGGAIAVFYAVIQK